MPGLVPTGISTGIGSLYKESVVSVPATGNYVLPAGNYWIVGVGANTKLQVLRADGTTWVDITAISVLPSGTVNSDGVSVRLTNAAGAGQNAVLILTG